MEALAALPLVSKSQWGEHPIGPLRTPDQLALAYQRTPGPSLDALRRQDKKASLTLEEYRRFEFLLKLEKYLQEDLRDAVLKLGKGWLYYHTHRSTHSPEGYPDTHIVGDGRSLFVELKREDVELVSGFQKWWLEGLVKAGHEVYVLRPSGFSAFVERLAS